ncbi:MAG: PAS domain-containing protein, partial [Actinomycetota bacterium]|nr:PAS domain-containing protein [Actinomycetota bacterium]
MSSRSANLGGARARPRTTSVLPTTPSAAYQRGLLQRVPAILYTADAGEFGAWQYVSPQIESILGFSPEEWCADPTLWAQRLHPDDRSRVLDGENRTADGQTPTGAAEYRLRHRDGSVVWVRDDALLLLDEDGERRWHGVMSDITEQKEAEAELARRAAQQAAVARLGEHALEGASIADLMQEAVDAAAALLNVEIAAVLELLPDRDAFFVRASHGTGRGQDTIPAGRDSQAGYAILTGAPVTVADWECEQRFQRSNVLRQSGGRSGLTVVIEGRRAPFGVLGLHATSLREFTPLDVDFAQSLANVLGDTFERQLTDDDI